MSAVETSAKGHPKGLYLLFTVEMWERFSYYGMRAILTLFMIKFLMFSTETAGNIYGWYTGLVYLTPLVGGYIADRYLGARKCIVIGALVMAAGEFALMFAGLSMPNPAAGVTAQVTNALTLGLFYTGLFLLILGNGFFKPNISTTVGKLYEQNDPRRDGAFTIFYMGINLGAFFSPLICGTLGEKYGWHYGFLSAGIGMIAGMLVLLWGQSKYLGEAGLHPGLAPKTGAGARKDEPLTKVEKQRIAVIFILAFFVIFFWSSFELAGSALTLFADQSTNRVIPIINWEFPASWFQSVNPLLIFILAPLFSGMWIRMARGGKEPSTPFKMAIGLGLLTLSMVLMVIASGLLETSAGKVSAIWLTGCYLLCTLGELCLSPIGLSMVTKLSPARFASLLMGTWFGSNFLANLVSGLFAGQYDKMSKTMFFMIPVASAGAATVLLLALVKPIKKWMHGVN